MGGTGARLLQTGQRDEIWDDISVPYTLPGEDLLLVGFVTGISTDGSYGGCNRECEEEWWIGTPFCREDGGSW
jgi:hypothetical protein